MFNIYSKRYHQLVSGYNPVLKETLLGEYMLTYLEQDVTRQGQWVLGGYCQVTQVNIILTLTAE